MKLYIFLFTLLRTLKGFSVEEFLNDTYNYRYELCSYNGIVTYNETTNTVSCDCGTKYTNEPSKEKYKYINAHLIQCSYERKSRFMVLFIALCLPFGAEFLYLGRYKVFTVIFLLSISVLALNIIVFILNYEINMKSKETKIQTRINKIRKKENKLNINKDNKCIKRLNVLSKILGIMYLLYIILDVIAHAGGFITDCYHVKTENDFGYMFTQPD